MQQRHRSHSHDVIILNSFLLLEEQARIYNNAQPKPLCSAYLDDISLSAIQTLSFHTSPISPLWTISCNSKQTTYYTADNSKLSTPVLSLISDSGHNSQFLLPTVSRQKTITEDSHSQRMRQTRRAAGKWCSGKAKGEREANMDKRDA